MISRNEAMGIVERTHKNLVYMRSARKNGADIHEVTHLFNSLLGLIVVPWERDLKGVDVLDTTIENLYDQGWPNMTPLIDEYPIKTKKLKDLVKHLRNAVAHGRFRFEGVESSSADSREPSDIKVVMCDQMKRRHEDYVRHWRAEGSGVKTCISSAKSSFSTLETGSVSDEGAQNSLLVLPRLPS